MFRTEDATAFAAKNNSPLSRFLALEKKWNTLLEQHRRQRHAPSIDKKILCSWNAIASKGLLEAYRTFNDTKTLEFATNNLEFLFNHLVEPNGGVHRYVYDNGQKTPGFLEDYAYPSVLVCTAMKRYLMPCGWNVLNCCLNTVLHILKPTTVPYFSLLHNNTIVC